MKVLVVSQYFYPEEFKINDLVRELIDRGHQVSVLTGKPNYPGGEYFEGYRYRGILKEDYHSAEVIRVPLRKRGKGGALNLIINYISYVINADRYIRRNEMVYDAILCYEISPITQAYPALLCKKMYGGKVLLWIQDLWPESVEAAGGVKNKLIMSILDRMVKRIYSKCDYLLVQSEGFRESILSKGDFASKIRYAPNWAEDLYLAQGSDDKPELSAKIPEGFLVMFAGNVGAAQDIESIIQAANETHDLSDIKWIIVGDGRARSKAEDQVKRLSLSDTVYFLGRYPMTMMPSFFSLADVMVVSLKNEHIFSLTIPAKTQSYMASGKPIASMMNGEGNRIIQEAECGLTASAGDFKKLADNVKALYYSNRADLHRMGKNGLNYYLTHFDKRKVVDTIIDAMKQ